ncbi:MaoC family dehydratase [Streptomyces sp. RTGN2]|uniref:MaoC family dehydratase n=1 Tax=Streptomyces sp. RTGN2 TaxID=3016525 RepID=UPI002552D3CF|nr:MaoC family dehydratase [Streptomyces sp. RTGN2]
MHPERVHDAREVPLDERYFEDYTAGFTQGYGSLVVTEREIVDFAARFDPQSFHLDPVAAERGPFGGLIASGWHTVALMMKLFAEHYLSTVASLGSPGVDELRWLEPVRPGTRLRLRVHTLDTRLSRSDPGRGVVRTLAELIDAEGSPVLRVTVVNLLRTRPGTGRPAQQTV